jgi:hypothetical protein
MKLIKKIMIVWLISWLPMASAVASAMPIYSATFSITLDTTAQAAVLDVEPAAALPCHSPDDNNNATDAQCAHCVMCHIAGAIIAPSIPVLPMTASHDCPHEINSVDFVSFIPTLPQRPPALSGI